MEGLVVYNCKPVSFKPVVELGEGVQVNSVNKVIDFDLIDLDKKQVALDEVEVSIVPIIHFLNSG